MTHLLIEVNCLIDIVFLNEGKHLACKTKTFSFITVPFTILVFANPSRWKSFRIHVSKIVNRKTLLLHIV